MSETARKPVVETVTARQWLLRGRVQGVGLRPAVARWAVACRVSGQVRNTIEGVQIVVEGSPSDLWLFDQGLVSRLPDEAEVTSIVGRSTSVSGVTGFVIAEQTPEGAMSAHVPSDSAVCKNCRDDIARPGDRRHGYPLVTCAQCGPRYSVIEAMPYDRARTTMQRFSLCLVCQREHASSRDRRFHAESIACPECGPMAWLTDRQDRVVARSADAVSAAVRMLLDGQIVALRGVGGYQILVDATNEDAIRRLRERKSRPAKPLAVMVASVQAAKLLAFVDSTEERVLASPANPIVVLSARAGSVVCPSVSAGISTLGVMLPTTGLHSLLLNELGRPVVATSGNREGEPLCYEIDESRQRLDDIADAWLHHDRPIANPIDDSVVRVMAGRAVTLRLARGLAPMTLNMPCAQPILALGGHQKSALAISNGHQTVLGPHIGDLGTMAVRERYLSHRDSLTQLYRCQPSVVAHDLHPDYFTSQWAEDQRTNRIAVQHHHAHVVAGMVEAGWLDREVLGVALDGAGYGPDGSLWGGEFLRCTSTRFVRVGHLVPFRLPGGEAAVREPWRIAVGAVVAALGRETARTLQWDNVSRQRMAMVAQIADNPRLTPMTTSAGRLFDAVTALGLGVTTVDFEGQAAMLWESEADPRELGAYEFSILDGAPAQIDWRPMLRQLMVDRRNGTAPAALAMRFHRGLADVVFRFCQRTAELPVVLAGGVFQNRRLVEEIAARFSDVAQPLAMPGSIPPNDGGLAAGQLAIALASQSVTKEL